MINDLIKIIHSSIYIIVCQDKGNPREINEGLLSNVLKHLVDHITDKNKDCFSSAQKTSIVREINNKIKNLTSLKIFGLKLYYKDNFHFFENHF